MGAGPERLLDSGLSARLEERGHRVRQGVVEATEGSWHAEIGTAFDLMRQLSPLVRAARKEGRFPLVLSGNCSASIGVIGGLSDRRTGIVWFDAHGDFNTPETTIGGFLDGMALAMVAGRCWKEMTRSVAGFAEIPEHRICLAGARDLDPLESEALDRSDVRRVGNADLEAELEAAVAAMATDADQVYVHLDLDVLDPSVATANRYAAHGGPNVERLERALRIVGRTIPIAAATLSAYDPAHDADGRACSAAIRLISVILDSAAGRA
jgi:arginase